MSNFWRVITRTGKARAMVSSLFDSLGGGLPLVEQ
jgi:hypothetical protein